MAESTIFLHNALTSQPEAIKSRASQSSNSGWVGTAPCGPKFSVRGDDAPAEEHLPVAVDRHPRRQRMARVGEPTRQTQPIARRVLGERRQGGGRLAPHGFVLGRVIAAARQLVRLPWLRLLFHRHDLEDPGLGRE